MKNITSILVPTDFSEPAQKAFLYALQFADRYEASIEVLHVVYPQMDGQDFPLLVSPTTTYLVEAAEEALKNFVEAGMKQAKVNLDLQSLPNVESRVVVGTPPNMIAETAKKCKADLIIMGTKGEHSASEEFFGSTTSNTLKQVTSPVLVVPEGANLDKTITVAYATNLDEAAPFYIWEATRFLEPLNCVLRLVHVQTQEEEFSPVKMNDIEEFFADYAPSLQLSFHNIKGKEVVEELNEFAKNWAVDLLIMYSPHRNFLERLFHKSTTRQEVLHGKVPVLVMKD